MKQEIMRPAGLPVSPNVGEDAALDDVCRTRAARQFPPRKRVDQSFQETPSTRDGSIIHVEEASIGWADMDDDIRARFEGFHDRERHIVGDPRLGLGQKAPSPAEGRVEMIMIGWIVLSYNMPRMM